MNGRKIFWGAVISCPKTLEKNVLIYPPPPLPTTKIFVYRYRKFFETIIYAQFAFQQIAKFFTLLLLIIKPYFGTLVSFLHFCPSSLPLLAECSPIGRGGGAPPSRTPMLGDVLMIIFRFLIENCCKWCLCGQGTIPEEGGGDILNIIYCSTGSI